MTRIPPLHPNSNFFYHPYKNRSINAFRLFYRNFTPRLIYRMCIGLMEAQSSQNQEDLRPIRMTKNGDKIQMLVLVTDN